MCRAIENIFKLQLFCTSTLIQFAAEHFSRNYQTSLIGWDGRPCSSFPHVNVSQSPSVSLSGRWTNRCRKHEWTFVVIDLAGELEFWLSKPYICHTIGLHPNQDCSLWFLLKPHAKNFNLESCVTSYNYSWLWTQRGLNSTVKDMRK